MYNCYSCKKKCHSHQSVKEELPPYFYTRHYCLDCYNIRKPYAKKISKIGKKMSKTVEKLKTEMVNFTYKINKLDKKFNEKIKAKNGR